MKKYIFLTFLLGWATVVLAQADIREMVKQQSRLAGELTGSCEGFAGKISGEDIHYHSTRPDCPLALLVRATDGTMAISWEAPVPKVGADQAEVAFFLITGMSLRGYDLTGRQPGFTLRMNGQPLFHFTNDLGRQWVVEGQAGSRMTFETFFVDMHGDAFGYTRIFLPAALLQPDKAVHFSITGDNAESQHWFMVFQCPDGLRWFLNKAAADTWFELELRTTGRQTAATLRLPPGLAGTRVKGSASNGWRGEWLLKADGEAATGTINLKGTLAQWDSVGLTIQTERAILMENYPIGRTVESSEIRPDLLAFFNPSKPSDDQWEMEGHLVASTIARDLDVIAASHLSRGTFHIMASSHQDIAWMDSPEACVLDRDELLITPALEQLKDNPHYANDMEDILMLREYLDRHPEKKNEIHELTREGRLTWGASYIQPYEEMYFGEPLIRQFYLGRKWFRKEFPGCDARIYWNVDVPGRTLQMPQILAKSGVDYMIISRHDKGLFHWAAPDGSKVLTYSPDHYYNSYVHLKKGFFETVSHLADLTRFWDRYYTPESVHPVMPVLSDADMALPDSYFDYIRTWESISAAGRDSGWKLPRLIHSTAERFMDEAVATGIQFPEIRGERPAVWLYIHGPSHYEALKYGRSAGRTLPAAEKMATFRSLAEGNWTSYPSELLSKAWESGIYPDHGWGGNQGTITDSTFQARFFEADSIARTIIRSSAEALASRIKHPSGTIPVTLFNTLSWERTDPVEVTVSLPDQGFRGIRLRDAAGREVPFQVTGTPVHYPSGAIKEVNILFIAEGVPSSGYKSWYVSKAPTLPGAGKEAPGLPDKVETAHYRISLAAGGQASLFDKELDREVWLTDQFRGGELFTMRSVGNGAGEFADIQQPDMEGFDRLSAYQAGWVVEENGPLRVAMATEARFRHNKARVTWLIYKTIKRIDVTVELIGWDGTAYREFRLAFPARLTDPEIAYEVPFGVVRVGRDELQHPAGERYTTPCPEVHPRGINNWISASDGSMGITFSSSVAVWDYVNVTDLPTAATLLQPVLLASRQSCHGLGPLYHQTGTHSMTFSLFTHVPGWQHGYQAALQANEPLVAVVGSADGEGDLPESWSFVNVDDPHTLISAIKKEDFGDGLVIRFYNTEGRDKPVTIRPNFSFRQATLTDLLEENGRPIRSDGELIPVQLGGHAIETILIKR